MFDSQTRFKFGVFAFITVVVSAWAKNWFPGISVEILGLAVLDVAVYIMGDTKRPSVKGCPDGKDQPGNV
jgi:hypothetical protein